MHRWRHFVLGIVLATTGNCIADEPAAGILKLEQTIPLPGVEGRIDHFDLDAVGERLFVCALGNNSVEVLDLRKGQRLHSISGLGAPQGLAYLPAQDRLLVANDKGGQCQVYNAKSRERISTVDLQDDADNVRFDSATGEIFVGFGDGGVAVINAAAATRTRTIKLAAHPEAFQLEKQGRRIFVNVPRAGHIGVIDRDKGEVVATWKPGGASANFPIALDEASHRLFVGCRNPAKLVVLDTESGATVASLDISGDTDEIFYDAKRHRLYAVCGEGYIDVIEQENADHYKRTAKVRTVPGARTGLFNPDQEALFVGVPHRGDQPAEIRRYRVR